MSKHYRAPAEATEMATAAVPTPQSRTQQLVKRGRRLTRFALVGLSGVVVNEIALAILVGRGHLNYLVAAVLATQCSTLWNFALVERWAFNDATPARTRLQRFAMFWTVNMITLALRGPILAALTSGLHIHYLISNLISLAILTLARFAVADSWIWANQPATEPTT
jgi:putative flippase GtrA